MDLRSFLFGRKASRGSIDTPKVNVFFWIGEAGTYSEHQGRHWQRAGTGVQEELLAGPKPLPSPSCQP